MDYSATGFPILHHHLELAQLMSIESTMSSNYLILCHHLLLPSTLPSSGVSSNQSALHNQWAKVLELQHQFFQ